MSGKVRKIERLGKSEESVSLLAKATHGSMRVC